MVKKPYRGVTMPLSSAQKQIATSPKRFRTAICGRRFGKTYLACRELARFSREPDRRCWYIAPTRGQGKGIVWDQLKVRLGSLNWIAKTNESDLIITLVNGSEIAIKSADAYDRMRGFSVDFVVFDEFADMDPDVWTAVRPTLSDRQGHAFFIGTPKGGRSSWAYDVYNNALTNDDWASFTFTTIDGGRVTEEEIESAKKDLDARTFQQEYLATWVDSASRIYYSFDRAHNVREVEDLNTDVIYTGWDFNIDPMSVVIAVRRGDDLYVIDEVRMYSSNTQEAVEEVCARYPNSRIWAMPDPASRQRKTSAGGSTDLIQLQNAGFVVKCPHSHTPVRDRINAVNSRLCSADGMRHLYISSKCKHTIEGLERQTYKDQTSQPEKGEYDHMMDALGYMIDYMFPIRKDVGYIEQPRRWGHGIAV
jgi:hypothetical protein